MMAMAMPCKPCLLTIGPVVVVVGCGDNSTFKGFNSGEERPFLYQTDMYWTRLAFFLS